MPRIAHPDLPDSDPVEVSDEAYALVWRDLGWVEAEDADPDQMSVALAGHEAAGLEPPDTHVVTAADVAAFSEFVPSDDPTAENPAATDLDLDDTDLSDPPSDTTDEPPTGQED